MYVEDNDGVDTEDSYPYDEEKEHCTFRSSDVGETLSSFGRVTPGDEEAMRAAIQQYVSTRLKAVSQLLFTLPDTVSLFCCQPLLFWVGFL